MQTTIIVLDAPPELVTFVSDRLVGDMAAALRAAAIADRDAAVSHLRAEGFGAASTAALVDQALSAAAEPVNA
jgi:hypothetical protein